MTYIEITPRTAVKTVALKQDNASIKLEPFPFDPRHTREMTVEWVTLLFIDNTQSPPDSWRVYRLEILPLPYDAFITRWNIWAISDTPPVQKLESPYTRFYSEADCSEKGVNVGTDDPNYFTNIKREYIILHRIAAIWQSGDTVYSRIYFNFEKYIEKTIDATGYYTMFDYPDDNPCGFSSATSYISIYMEATSTWINAYENIVRIYFKALSKEEMEWNLKNPFNPVRRGLALWCDVFTIKDDGWYDKIDSSRKFTYNLTSIVERADVCIKRVRIA
mgnify:CR=1 FL=1